MTISKPTWLSTGLCLLLLCFAGCSDMFEGSDENMRDWFEWGTELKLPKEAQFLAGRNFGPWLSIIYLKIKVPPGYKKTLDENLTQGQKVSFALPDKMELPGWDVADKTLVYYTKTTGAAEEGGFISQLAFEESSGILYCIFDEYRP